jgi:tetratricopeptide (TPR) repeat protein
MATYDKEMIIRYVEGELSAEERQQFEADLRKDPSLSDEIALYKEVRSVLQDRLKPDEGSDALRTTLQGMNKKYFGVAPATGAKRISMTRWLAGMAAAASVILAVVLLWPSGKGNYLDSLGRTEMISTTERGGNADSLLQQAAVFFNQQQFDKALPLLDKAVKEDSSSQLALFYRGVAAWHTGAADAARKDLEQVYKGGSLLQYEAAFYMALGYAGQENKPAAKEWLSKIPEGTPVSEKAKELAGKLK